MSATPIRALFLDIGGVLLSNGWDHGMRRHAAEHFGLDYDSFALRHEAAVPPLELDRITLDQYLDWVVFNEPRNFSAEEFRDFMFGLSTPNPAVIDLMRGLKEKYGLRVFAVSNESRLLNDYRLRTFGLTDWMDAFVSSCYVGIAKPDPKIWRLALDLAQVPPAQVVFVDNTGFHCRVARELGMHAIEHRSAGETLQELAALGLT